jgi:hypothetical protein
MESSANVNTLDVPCRYARPRCYAQQQSGGLSTGSVHAVYSYRKAMTFSLAIILASASTSLSQVKLLSQRYRSSNDLEITNSRGETTSSRSADMNSLAVFGTAIRRRSHHVSSRKDLSRGSPPQSQRQRTTVHNTTPDSPCSSYLAQHSLLCAAPIVILSCLRNYSAYPIHS